MEKYKKVIKPKETTTQDEEEIRVTAAGSVSAYVSRAAKLFNELDKTFIVIAATGNALTKAVTSAEVIKRRFKGLHQVTKLGNREVVDEYEPIEEGLDKVSQTRNLPSIEIRLSKEELDTSDKGYQAPLDESEVKEVDPEELTSRGRGRGRGKGRGSSSGKGKGKDKGAAGAGKGKGKDKSSDAKGKGKGKGKGKDEAKGKGKGKKGDAKGKGKGNAKGGKSGWEEESWPRKGKGKSKGGWDDAPKGKGKGAGKKQSWEWDSYPPVRQSKGKWGWDDSSYGYGGYDDYRSGKSGGKSAGKSKSKGGKGKGW